MARRRSRSRVNAETEPTTLDVVPNQVFVGLPWTSRTRWDHVIGWLRARSPLSFIVVGRNDKQDAEDLLAVIKDRIDSSSYGIFDATAGNPNVSLEYGYAEAIDLPRVLYLSTHESARRAVKDAPIIADLAGKRRNQCKQEKGLKRLLGEFSKGHSYTIRFDRFMQSTFNRASGGATWSAVPGASSPSSSTTATATRSPARSRPTSRRCGAWRGRPPSCASQAATSTRRGWS